MFTGLHHVSIQRTVQFFIRHLLHEVARSCMACIHHLPVALDHSAKTSSRFNAELDSRTGIHPVCRISDLPFSRSAKTQTPAIQTIAVQNRTEGIFRLPAIAQPYSGVRLALRRTDAAGQPDPDDDRFPVDDRKITGFAGRRKTDLHRHTGCHCQRHPSYPS